MISYIYEVGTSNVVCREVKLPYATITMSNSGRTSVYFDDSFYPTTKQKHQIQDVISRYLYSVVCDETMVNLVNDIRLVVEPLKAFQLIENDYQRWLG